MQNKKLLPFFVTCIVGMIYFAITINSFGEALPYFIKDNNFPEVITPPDGNWIFDLDEERPNKILVEFELKAPGWTKIDANPVIILKEIGFNNYDPALQDSIGCLNRLELNPDDFTRTHVVSISRRICPLGGVGGAGLLLQTINQTETIPITYSLAPQNFWYPYDALEIPIAFRAKLARADEITKTEDATPLIVLRGDVTNRDWAITMRLEKTKPLFEQDQIIVKQTLIVRFERPLIHRIAYPLLLIALVIMTSLLASGPTSSFLEGAIALFIGVIGLRQLILPSQIQTGTLLETLLLGVYILFILPLVQQKHGF